LGWRGRIDGKTIASYGSAGEIRYAGRLLQLTKPRTVSREQDGVSFTYLWPEEPALEVTIQHYLTHQNRAWSWTREVQIKGPRTLTSDLTIFTESGLQTLPSGTWLPLINGVGASLGTNQAAAYRLAGALPNPGVSLALPMVSVPLSSDGKQSRRLIRSSYFSR
jgi:hypothetical protein